MPLYDHFYLCKTPSIKSNYLNIPPNGICAKDNHIMEQSSPNWMIPVCHLWAKESHGSCERMEFLDDPAQTLTCSRSKLFQVLYWKKNNILHHYRERIYCIDLFTVKQKIFACSNISRFSQIVPILWEEFSTCILYGKHENLNQYGQST